MKCLILILLYIIFKKVSEICNPYVLDKDHTLWLKFIAREIKGIWRTSLKFDSLVGNNYNYPPSILHVS